MSIVPQSTPKITLADCLALIKKSKVTDNVCMVGIRGYWAKNKRGIYDDAIALVSPTAFLVVNANTDPSAWRKGIATLKTGVWRYKTGIHGLSRPVGPRRYPAFVQAEKVTVARDGQADETGFFGINIHRGSLTTTSSLGCQTIWVKQWDSFKTTAYNELKRHGQKTFPYILLNSEHDKVPVVQA